MFIEIHGEITIFIKVIPKSRINEIMGWENGYLKIRIKAIAEKNKANEEVIKFFSKVFQIPQNQINIISGKTSRKKRVLLENITLEQANKYISKFL